MPPTQQTPPPAPAPAPTMPPMPPAPPTPQQPAPAGGHPSYVAAVASILVAALVLALGAYYYYTFVAPTIGEEDIELADDAAFMNDEAAQSNSVDTLEAELEAEGETNLDGEVTNLNNSL